MSKFSFTYTTVYNLHVDKISAYYSHNYIHTLLANTTICISLHSTRAFSYTAVIVRTKELSIRTGTYNDTEIINLQMIYFTIFCSLCCFMIIIYSTLL